MLSIDLYMVSMYILVMGIIFKKSKVFRVTKEYNLTEMQGMNDFLRKTNGRIASTYSVNGNADQEYIVLY